MLLQNLFCDCSYPSLRSPERLASKGTPRPPSSARASTDVGGAVPACVYEADPYDPVDAQLGWHLLSLDQEALRSLTLRRLGTGSYEVDGRRVSLFWGTNGTCGASELMVTEDSVGDGESGETTLHTYLEQAADVNAALAGRAAGSPLVARIPRRMRLTFSNDGEQLGDPTAERCRSMRVACEQAKLREHAAKALEMGEPAARAHSPHTRGVEFAAPRAPPITLALSGATAGLARPQGLADVTAKAIASGEHHTQALARQFRGRPPQVWPPTAVLPERVDGSSWPGLYAARGGVTKVR